MTDFEILLEKLLVGRDLSSSEMSAIMRRIMAVRHREHPLVGVQFHPESILTEHGHALLEHFLNDRF